MRCNILLVLLAGPITALGATHTIGIDVGRAHTAGMHCPVTETGSCELSDGAQRVFYELRPGEAVGFRATFLYMNDLRITRKSDPIFNSPGINTSISDLSVTYSYPIRKQMSLAGRIGLARWTESRSREVILDDDKSDGYSPVLGFNVDFGGKRLRAGFSADIYPSVGDADYVTYFGAGLRVLFGRSRALGDQ